jgi:hypothetical protein
MSDFDERTPEQRPDREVEERPVDGDGMPVAPEPLEFDTTPPDHDGDRLGAHAGGGEPPRVSDDHDLDVPGDGVSETPIRAEYESMARRNDLARRLEDLVVSAREWARDEGSDEARDIAEGLALLYERLGAPAEASDAGRGGG